MTRSGSGAPRSGAAGIAGAAGAMVLAPGAGSDRDHHTLVAIEEAFHPLPVDRLDFPYRREGRKAPDRAPKLIAAVVEAFEALTVRTGVAPEQVVIGGRSMGGRMCSLAASEGLACKGLVLISYPLHPPGRHDRLRVEHFPALDLPCLFISGTRDPFGAPEEFESAIEAIPGPVTIEWIEGARHDLNDADEAIIAAIRAWLGTCP